MNISYVYNGDNVTIIDENGDTKFTYYSDNLEKILVKENLIEAIEEYMQRYENSLDFHYRPYIPWMVPTMYLTVGTIGTIINHLYGSTYGDIDLGLLIGASTLLLPIIVPMEIVEYRNDRHYKKVCQADVTVYEYLRNELKRQNESLLKLQCDKVEVNPVNEFEVKKVNDLEELKTLRNCLELIDNLGFDFKKYYDLYKQGKLESVLANDGYSEDVCQRAKQFFDEKSNALIKKYNFPIKKSNR